jgi:DNA-binding NarL/FixJ family response regulator
MNDEDVVRRAADILGVKSIHRHEFKNPRWKPCYIMQVNGQRAADLMRRIRPMMGQRRQGQIDVALGCWNPRWERNGERNEAILNLHREGLGYAEIGHKLDLSRQVVRGVIRRYLEKNESL